MRKLGLILAASTMLAPVGGGAMASTQSIHFTTYCDVLNFTITKNLVGELENASSCTADIMGGFETKIKGMKGKWIFVGGPRFGGGSEAWGWIIQLPFKTGNEAYLYDSTDGVNYSEIASATYTVGTPGRSAKGRLPPMGRVHADGIHNPTAPKTLHFGD